MIILLREWHPGVNFIKLLQVQLHVLFTDSKTMTTLTCKLCLQKFH